MRALALLLLWLAPASATAQATLLTGLGGPAGLGEIELPAVDDGNEVVDVRPVFPSGMPFYGDAFNSVFVSTNGYVSLGGSRAFAPRTLMPFAGRAMIAAWSYDILPTGGASGPNRGWVDVDPDMGRVVLTYQEVEARGGMPGQAVTVQLVLRPGAMAGVTEVEWRFVRCDWSVVGSSAVHAQAGVNRGDAAPGEFTALPGSGTAAVRDLCTSSNVSMPGIWRYTIGGTAITPTCGNGVRETGEACDDGNTMDGDGCTSSCMDAMGPVCGNNLVEPPEECDDGDLNPGDGCDAMCRTEVLPACGDGTVDATETCDDGNTTPGDGCDENCRIEVDGGEEIDAGEIDAGDPDFDAGPFDVGIRRDTGPDAVRLGGGGCVCRAGPGTGPGLSAVGALVLALALGRRRRRS